MTGFFSTNTGRVTFPGEQSDDPLSYWNCQEGAYWAIKAHQTTDNATPAVVSLPTGGGKTAVMMLAAFEYGADRALIIVPSDAIRTQIKERFENLTGLNKADAFSGTTDGLEVKIHRGRPTSEEAWEEYSDADVVVSTPNSISEPYANADEDSLVLPPAGFFDLLLVDEAHHTPARGWRYVLESFDDIPQLLFTATPFRREDQPLPGDLVYHYPIQKARDEGIYHEVGLETVDGNSDQLVDTAVRTLTSLQNSNDQATLLIRTNTTGKADNLAEKYNEETPLDVCAVHSKTEDNQDKLERLREGAIDGVVVVNKFIEGIDVADLQVAVFHVPPKSFPRMMQIVGRLARKPSDEAPATIIATEEAVKSASMSEAVRQLYRDDTGWADVAEDLISEYLSVQESDKPGGAPPLDAVSPDNIRPYKTVTVYSLSDTEFEMVAQDSNSALVGSENSLGYILSTPDSMWGSITTTQESPTWGTSTILQSTAYDLHLYCVPEDSELLFEYTSDVRQANTIRSTLIHDEAAATRVTGKRLSKAMQSLSAPKFKAAGLTNVHIPSGTQPEHKLLTGSEVQGAVYHSDTRRYTHGHVFASFSADGEAVAGDSVDSEDSSSTTDTRGISSSKGAIWSNSKAGLSAFKQWCETLARKLNADREPAIQHLEDLNQGVQIDAFDEEPFSIMPYPSLLASRVSVKASSDQSWQDVEIAMGIAESVDTPSQSIEVSVSIEPVGSDIQATYDVEANDWSGAITEYQFQIPDADAHSSLPGDEFLRQYPPRFHVDANSIVTGGAKYVTETTLDEFDPSSLRMELQPAWGDYIEEDAVEKPGWWDDVDETTDLTAKWESEPIESVFCAMVETLTSRYGGEEYVLFCDDMGDEIADFIEFRTDEKQITFYHVKRSKPPGVRISYFKDIYHQTLRSLRYTYTQDLVEQLAGNQQGTSRSQVVHGEETFEEITQDFVPTDWSYTICGVHPGLRLDFDPEAGHENVGRLLSECAEQVERYNVEFGMIGPEDDQP